MKGALVVGIDSYPGAGQLHGCVNDAVELASVLSSHEDGSRNFQVELQKNVLTKASLRAMISRLFQADLHTAVFSFSGHGSINERGGFIITPDTRKYDEGIAMDELLAIVNQSPIKDKIIILDCCHAGAMGTPVITGNAAAHIGEGVVILAAARSAEGAMEVNGQGVFTNLLLAALRGGAADITGRITAAGIYSCMDESLGFMEQRPQFRANINRFIVLRNVEPELPLAVLKKITTYFTTTEQLLAMDPSYEATRTEVAIPERVTILKHLQKMNRVRLVVPVGEEHLYDAAIHSKACKLTALGKHYWNLVKKNYI
jgi:hypothetical protein